MANKNRSLGILQTIFRIVILLMCICFASANESFAESTVFGQNMVTAALSAEAKRIKRVSITGSANTLIGKFEAVSKYYRFPPNVLIAAGAENGGTEEDQLDEAIQMAEQISLSYLSGEDMPLLLANYYVSTETATTVLARAKVIADRLYPAK
jgi:hypothetical protein